MQESGERFAGARSVKWRRWAVRSIAVALGTFFSAFVVSQLWPHFRSESGKEPDKRVIQASPREDASKFTKPPDFLGATGPSKKDESLVLAGTQVLSDAASATALIGLSVTTPQTYRLGALLPNGARISEIHRDRVVLTRDGKTATLFVTTDPGSTPVSARVSGDVTLVAAAAPPVAAEGVNPPSSEPADSLAITSPEYRDGTLLGVRVYPGSNASLFHAVGLKPGDFLPNVSSDEVNRALRSVLEGSAVSIRVSRDGSGENLTLKLPAAQADTPPMSGPAA